MGDLAFQCKYDKFTDKKSFVPSLKSTSELDKSAGSQGVAHMKNSLLYAKTLFQHNHLFKNKYNGEMFFTKTHTRCKHDPNKHVYMANTTLCDINQGGLAFSCIGHDMIATVRAGLSGATTKEVDCKEIEVNSCYEQGLRIAPLGGGFKIHIDANNNEAMRIVDYLKNNPDNHPNDQIPNEYSRAQIQCDSFENINEYSNYINSIKEFNGPNYIRNIYYSALFIFLFYIFIKLYTKK